MTQRTVIGISLMGIAFIILVVFGVYLASRGNIFSSGVTAEAVIFIDVPGRIAIDGNLQIEGPAPVPVSAGDHTLILHDNVRLEPLDVSLKKGEFLYVPNPSFTRKYSTRGSRGVAHVAAFPPNTMIEIPDCTPLDTKYPSVCKGGHVLSAELSPGSYTIKYSNPQFGEYEERITVAADSVVRREHSYISTVQQWNEWKIQHGDIIEQQYPRYYRHSRGSGLLLPFEATAELVDELFD